MYLLYILHICIYSYLIFPPKPVQSLTSTIHSSICRHLSQTQNIFFFHFEHMIWEWSTFSQNLRCKKMLLEVQDVWIYKTWHRIKDFISLWSVLGLWMVPIINEGKTFLYYEQFGLTLIMHPWKACWQKIDFIKKECGSFKVL